MTKINIYRSQGGTYSQSSLKSIENELEIVGKGF